MTLILTIGEDPSRWYLYDIEPLALRAFKEMWYSKAYSTYIKQLVGPGPPGTYKQTCNSCMLRKLPAWSSAAFYCRCRGPRSRFKSSSIEDSESCLLADNHNGRLVCLKRTTSFVADYYFDDPLDEFRHPKHGTVLSDLPDSSASSSYRMWMIYQRWVERVVTRAHRLDAATILGIIIFLYAVYRIALAVFPQEEKRARHVQ